MSPRYTLGLLRLIDLARGGLDRMVAAEAALDRRRASGRHA